MSGLHRDLADAGQTAEFGACLARMMAGGAGGTIWLEGDLGAGKTTLARGFLRALGVSGPIRSPTYTLMEPYSTAAGDVLHMDLYRLADAEELWQLGLDSYPPESTLWLVEWPERAGGLLPEPDLHVRLEAAGDGRHVRVDAAADLLSGLAKIDHLLKVQP